MFNFFEKLIIKNVVKRLLKKLPNLKTKAEYLLEDYGDDLIEKVFKTVEQIIINFAEKYTDKSK